MTRSWAQFCLYKNASNSNKILLLSEYNSMRKSSIISLDNNYELTHHFNLGPI